MTQHNYKNPSKAQDLGHVEAQVTKGKKYYDKDGWEISPPISDRECIYRCLENCINLAGLDKVQVMRLMEDFETMKTEFVRNEEYPVLCCLLYTSPSPRDRTRSRMPSSA